MAGLPAVLNQEDQMEWDYRRAMTKAFMYRQLKNQEALETGGLAQTPGGLPGLGGELDLSGAIGWHWGGPRPSTGGLSRAPQGALASRPPPRICWPRASRQLATPWCLREPVRRSVALIGRSRRPRMCLSLGDFPRLSCGRQTWGPGAKLDLRGGRWGQGRGLGPAGGPGPGVPEAGRPGPVAGDRRSSGGRGARARYPRRSRS